MRGLVQLYDLGSKVGLIESQYGTIPYLQYLHMEKERIEKATGRVAGVVERGSKASLWVDDVRESRYNRRKK